MVVGWCLDDVSGCCGLTDVWMGGWEAELGG